MHSSISQMKGMREGRVSFCGVGVEKKDVHGYEKIFDNMDFSK